MTTIEILSELRSNYNCFDEQEEPVYRALSEAIKAVSVQPDIVHCRECKYFAIGLCERWRYVHESTFVFETGLDDFCSRGKRIEQDAEH